jgi:hypothetical protein
MRIWCIIGIVIFTTFSGHLSAQENLIKNGGFSDSTKFWTLNQNSSQATGAVKSENYEISITQGGTGEHAPQLLQYDIALSKNEAYTLSFDAWASDTGFIRGFLSNNNTYIPYSDTTAGKVRLFPSKRTFTIPFVMTNESDAHTRLQFNCGISPLSKIFIDNVSVTKRNEPVITVLAPAGGEKWGTGTEKKISWMNTGSIAKVVISYISESGKLTTIAEKVQNVNEFWWKIPASALSSGCKIVVSDTTGAIIDTSAVFSIAQASIPAVGEIIKNGDFSDSSSWSFENSSSGKAKGVISGGQYMVTIDTILPLPWQVKLFQSGIALEKGKIYKCTFDAYASTGRKIFANIGLANGPYTSFTGGDTIPLPITNLQQTYSFTFIMNGASTSDARIEFNVANDSPRVFIDNVSLRSVPTPPIFISEPTEGSVWKNGSEKLIKWIASDTIKLVQIDYSIDNGGSWLHIADSLQNMGEFSWGIPNIISEKCLLRIRTLDSSITGISSLFQINKTGVPIRTGELIVNGKFLNGTNGWNPLSLKGGAQATSAVRNGSGVISISEPGTVPQDIILSQSNIPLISGKQYTLMFETFAPGDRNITFDLVTNDEKRTSLLDSTIENTFKLPASMQTFTFVFKPTLDVEDAVLEFHLGGTRATVYIDNISLNDGTSAVRMNASINKIEMFGFIDRGRIISFKMGTPGTLGIYTLNGKLIKKFTASSGIIEWDKKDQSGALLSRGTYIAAMKTSSAITAKKVFIK